MGAGKSCSNCQRQEKLVIAQQVHSSCLSADGDGLENIDSWDFNVREFNEAQVEVVASLILLSIRGDCLTLDGSDSLNKFAHSVCNGYLPNSYHNSRHALDVLHAVSRLGQLLPWDRIFDEHERFALGVAAIAHDIGHFGLTNVFLVDMRDDLAVCYNDISPLENMHCSKLFRILSEETTNVFSHLSQLDYGRVRKMIIDAILNTDPAQHVRMLNDLQAVYAGDRDILNGQSSGSLRDGISELLTSSENKQLVARTLLHGSDLSNPAKPWKITLSWAKAVLDEFFAQGDQEKTLGLTIGMLNDRATVSLPNSQLGFIQFMVAPFVASYARIFRNWWDVLPMLASNVGEWGNMSFEETGTDVSSRVQTVRNVLEAAKQVESVATAVPEEATAAAEEAEPIDDTNKDRADSALSVETTDEIEPDLSNSLMPWVPSKTQDADQQCIVVREVRRWRDIRGEATPRGESPGSEHRELVLLYVLSDRGALKSQKDIVMKFNHNREQHFQPESKATRKSAVLRNAVPVAVSADTLLSRMEPNDFDELLNAVLDRKMQLI